MVDNQPDFALGENVLKSTDDKDFGLVELSQDVIRGEALVVSGVTSEGTEIVSLISALTDDVKYLAMTDGLAGTLSRVMHKGRTKVTFGAAVIAGDRIKFTTASKVITTTATNYSKGSAVDAAAADDDLGFIDFDGGINPLGVSSS